MRALNKDAVEIVATPLWLSVSFTANVQCRKSLFSPLPDRSEKTASAAR
jgi:hypothetical protein